MKRRTLMVYVAVCMAILAAPITAQAIPMVDPPIAAASGAGMNLYVTGSGPVQATYLGDSAAYSNDLYLVGDSHKIFNNHATDVGTIVDLGTFGVGTQLTFRMHVNNTGRDYLTGAAAVNPDNHVHARVQDNGWHGQTLVSFEDLFNGPYNFNDLSFALTGVSTTPVQASGGHVAQTGNGPTSIPEPAPLALMGIGLLALGRVRCRGTGAPR